MNNAMTRVVVAGSLLLVLGAVLISAEEAEGRNKDTRSPAVENDDFPTFDDEQPSEFSIANLISGRVGKFFNDFLQFPASLFRFFSGILANQPFAKLREEVRNLNISYPK